MGKSSSPPPQPDYAGAAAAQGEANIDAARINAALNRVDQFGPFGSTTFDFLGNDRWAQTTQLSPAQQELLQKSEAAQSALGDLGIGQLDRVQNSLSQPFETQNLPSRISAVPMSEFETGINAPNVAFSDIDFSSAPERADAPFQMGVDFSSLPELPGSLEDQRNQVIDTVYGMAERNLEPQFQQEEEALRTRLMNSGIPVGSEAWTRAFDDFNRTKQQAFGDARDRAILLGGQEQSRLFGDTLASRNQVLSEILSGGQFGNQAAQLANQYGLTARDQAVAELFGRGQFANQAAQQDFGNELSRLGLFNEAQNQAFGQSVNNANMQNQARENAIQEQLFQRQLPFNELTALMSGSQVTFPQFGQVPQSQGIQPSPVFDAALGQGQNAIDVYNQQQQIGSNNLNAGLQAGSAALMFF